MAGWMRFSGSNASAYQHEPDFARNRLVRRISCSLCKRSTQRVSSSTNLVRDSALALEAFIGELLDPVQLSPSVRGCWEFSMEHRPLNYRY